MRFVIKTFLYLGEKLSNKVWGKIESTKAWGKIDTAIGAQ